MEEEKKEQAPKLSYDELKGNFDNLMMQYNKLMGEYRQAVDALNQLDYTQFFLGLLFKVMEHPEMYTDTFVTWASKKVEDAMYTFDKAMNGQPEQKDEAE